MNTQQQAQLQQAAETYRKNDFIPIPLIGKKPIIEGWSEWSLETETTEKVAERFQHHQGNIGILVWNFDILDIDKYLGLQWLNSHPELHKTVMTSTGREPFGRHIYVKIKKTSDRRTGKLYYNDVHIGELKSLTRKGTFTQVVVYPSIHPITKKMYMFINDPSSFDIVEIEDLASIGLELREDHNGEEKQRDPFIFKEKRYYSIRQVKNIKEFLCKEISKKLKEIENTQIGDRNNTLYKKAFYLATLVGYNNEVINQIKKSGLMAGLPLSEIEATIKSAFDDGTERMVLLVDETINRSTIIKLILNTKYHFRYNVIKGVYEIAISGGDFRLRTDRDDNSILAYYREGYNFSISKSDLVEIVESDYTPEYHVFREYFTCLPLWDGKTDYISILSKCVQVVSEQESLWQDYLKRWLVASVATMLESSVNHQCLVLQGQQGIYKTTFLNLLAPIKLYNFCGYIRPESKDSEILVSEKSHVNLDELESTTRSERSFLKSLITKEVITVRRPYGRNPEELRKHASFCASINQSQFLDDEEGTRRFLVVEVEHIDISPIKQDLIDKVYAQAYALFKQGYKYWFDGNEIFQINKNNEAYAVKSSEEELINKLYKPGNAQQLTATEITMAIEKEANKRFNNRLVGRILKKNGFRRSFNKSRKSYVYDVEAIPDDY